MNAIEQKGEQEKNSIKSLIDQFSKYDTELQANTEFENFEDTVIDAIRAGNSEKLDKLLEENQPPRIPFTIGSNNNIYF